MVLRGRSYECYTPISNLAALQHSTDSTETSLTRSVSLVGWGFTVGDFGGLDLKYIQHCHKRTVNHTDQNVCS